MQADAGEALRLLPLGKIGIDRLLQGGIRIALRCARLRVLVPAFAMRRAGACRDSGKDQQAGQRHRPRAAKDRINILLKTPRIGPSLKPDACEIPVILGPGSRL